MEEKIMLMTVSEVMKVLRINRVLVYHMIRKREIEGFKVGADWRVKRDSVEKLAGPIPESMFLKESN